MAGLDSELAELAERLRERLLRLRATTPREASFFLGCTPNAFDRRAWRRAEAALLLAGMEPDRAGRWRPTEACIATASPVALRRHTSQEETPDGRTE